MFFKVAPFSLFVLWMLIHQNDNFVDSKRHGRLVVDGEVDLYQEIANLKQEIARLKQSTGTTYIRWGRTTCPSNGTTRTYEDNWGTQTLFCAYHHYNWSQQGQRLLDSAEATRDQHIVIIKATFKGYMAGSSTSRSGSPADYVCLPSDPNWDYYEDTLQDGILITGIQYEFAPHFGTSAVKFFGAELKGAEAPCALCHTSRNSVIMIPGRKDCYSGWTKEYNGYLVGGFPAYNDASEYVCLDRRPETVPHSGHWDHENLLYFVEGNCGQNLACPPYVHGRELACVVCSL